MGKMEHGEDKQVKVVRGTAREEVTYLETNIVSILGYLLLFSIQKQWMS